MPDEPPPLPNIVFLMAALIAAVKTARFEPREYNGMYSPRFQSAMSDSLVIAKLIYEKARTEK